MVNQKIKKLKINNYKNKIESLLINITNTGVLHLTECSYEDREFIKYFYNNKYILKVDFPIYDYKNNKYFDSIKNIKEEAFEMLKENLIIFNDFKIIEFTYCLHEEYFKVTCNSTDIDKILSCLPEIQLPFVIYNKEKSMILSLDRLEYEIEYLKFDLRS
jgi:hypothetical protein